MFKQTETKYKSVKLGFGEGSIYDNGCYLVSLCNGLNQKGYSFTPESLNEFFKTPSPNGAWIGQYRNYIDVVNLNKYYPDIFVSFQQIEPWNDVPAGLDLVKDDLVVVCKVDGRAIGAKLNADGSIPTHFVLLTGTESGVAVIYDPYSGVSEKITKRWGKYGNILGLRIFKVKKFAPTLTMEKLPKDQVIKDIYTFLCDGFSQGEIDFRLQQGKNIVDLGNDIAHNDKRFKKKYIPEPTVINIPVIEYVDKPVYIQDNRVEQIKNIMLSKNFFWVKLNKIKELLSI